MEDFGEWLKARKLDLHWSWTPAGEACITAIRGKKVWNGTAAKIPDAIELLKAAVEASWCLNVPAGVDQSDLLHRGKWE